MNATDTGTWITSFSGQSGGVAVGPAGNVYVIKGGQLFKYSSSGSSVLNPYTSNGNIESACNNGDNFTSGAGIHVDSNEKIYIADLGGHMVHVINSSGTCLLKFGDEGTADGQFKFPADIVTDSDDNIYVAETNG